MSKEITRTAIENAFLELLSEQPISEISIRDIADRCGINRNTFYYHYKNIPDLLESVVKKLVDETIAKHPPTYDSLEECFLSVIAVAQSNKRIIYNIYHSTSRAIFERHLWHVCDYTISSFANSFADSIYEAESPEYNVVKDFLKYECFGFAIDWINRGMPDDVEEKTRVLIRLATANYKNNLA